MSKIILKILISLILLTVIIKNVESDELYKNISAIKPSVIVFSLCMMIIQSLFVSSRWKIIISRIAKPLPFIDIVKIHYMSLSSSLLIPNIVAEPAIKSFLMKKYNVSLQSVLISIVLDKVFVIGGLLIMTLIVMPLIFVLYRTDRTLICFYIGAIALILLLYILFKIIKFKDELFYKYPIFVKYPILASFKSYMFTEYKFVYKCIMITCASQLSAILAVYILSSHMQYYLTIIQCLILLPPIMLVATLPISFNGWGIREISMIYLLNYVNIPTETALALSIQFGIIGILLWSIGIVFWVRFKI